METLPWQGDRVGSDDPAPDVGWENPAPVGSRCLNGEGKDLGKGQPSGFGTQQI